MHYSLQSYDVCFKNLESKYVTIADSHHYDVQQLLKESSLLITDYSSIFFDFAYLGKPEVFFQFDQKDFRAMHYAEGYFSYDDDGFGPVFRDEKDVADYIINRLYSGCLMEPMYHSRMKKFFTLHDNHNCERTYNAILQLR